MRSLVSVVDIAGQNLGVLGNSVSKQVLQSTLTYQILFFVGIYREPRIRFFKDEDLGRRLSSLRTPGRGHGGLGFRGAEL